LKKPLIFSKNLAAGSQDRSLPGNCIVTELPGLAGRCLDILSHGYTVCVDELETSIHPLMMRELLRLFFSATENQKGAQILFRHLQPIAARAGWLAGVGFSA
jgi:hypothetical protein